MLKKTSALIDQKLKQKLCMMFNFLTHQHHSTKIKDPIGSQSFLKPTFNSQFKTKYNQQVTLKSLTFTKN